MLNLTLHTLELAQGLRAANKRVLILLKGD